MDERQIVEYGHCHVDLNAIEDETYIICAGLGNNVAFEAEMIKRHRCIVVGVDPTALTAATVKKQSEDFNSKFVFVRKALWCDNNGVRFSRARSNGAGAYTPGRTVKVATISMPFILDDYPEATLLKMNIEGAEYETWNHWDPKWIMPPKQISIRFHHRKADVPFGLSDTKKIVAKIRAMGYETVYGSDANAKNADHEVVFVRK
jgi:hypothetical protein